MENASKALLMAAVILISVIILSLGVYLFIYFSDYAKGVNDDIKTNQIEQFNSQFLSYQGKDLTIYDVITLANMAKDYNQENGYEVTNGIKPLGYITVTVPNELTAVIGENKSNNISNIENKDLIGKEITIDEGTENEHNEYVLTKYNCTVTVNNITKLVENVTIIQ